MNVDLSVSLPLPLPLWLQMSEKMELSEKQAEEGLVDEAQALLAEVRFLLWCTRVFGGFCEERFGCGMGRFFFDSPCRGEVLVMVHTGFWSVWCETVWDGSLQSAGSPGSVVAHAGFARFGMERVWDGTVRRVEQGLVRRRAKALAAEDRGGAVG